MTEHETDLLSRARALLEEAKVVPLSGAMADRLWAVRHEIDCARPTLTDDAELAFYTADSALRLQWQRHRY